MVQSRIIKRILISTMPRSASVFFSDFIAALFRFEKLDPTFTGGFCPIPPEWDPYKLDQTYLNLRDGQVIFGHYHLTPEIRILLDDDNLLVFYLHRDPRDMAVSAALYIKYVLTHQFLHPTFSRLSDADAIGLMLSGGIIPVKDLPYDTEGKGAEHVVFDGMKYYINVGYPWLLHPRVAHVRYEDFTKSPAETMSNALELVGVQISKETIQSVAEKKNFKNATGGRCIGVEDKSSHFRKGITGDYKNYFTDYHRALCKLIIGEDLIRLGYENGLNWSSEG